MEKKIEYWDCSDDTEILRFEDFDEAIEAYLDDQHPLDLSENIKVFGFARQVVDPKDFTDSVLEHSYEYLGEHYDGEDGHDQCEIIKKAAAKFVQTYLENYTVWVCGIVKTEEVNVGEWVKKHRLDWIKQDHQ